MSAGFSRSLVASLYSSIMLIEAHANSYPRDISQPLARYLGLEKLPEHAHVILLSFAFFLFVHIVLAPAVSLRLFPEAFGTACWKARNNWSIHVVSQVHVLLVVPLAASCLGLTSLSNDRAFGWDNRAGFVQAIACGYFLWDSVDTIVNFVYIGFVIHGVLCLAIFTLSFKSFMAYYGVRCLLWETSTLFLNIHWFLDKTGRKGTKVQFVNGVFLILTFFCVRIVYGGKVSYDFFHTLYDVRNQMPLAYILVYALGNIALQALNWFWFAKMVAGLCARLGNPVKECQPRQAHEPKVKATEKHDTNGMIGK